MWSQVDICVVTFDMWSTMTSIWAAFWTKNNLSLSLCALGFCVDKNVCNLSMAPKKESLKKNSLSKGGENAAGPQAPEDPAEGPSVHLSVSTA